MRTETPVKETSVRKVMNRKLPHFRCNTEVKVLYSIDEKGKETEATEETGLIDRRIISKIERDHNDLEAIDVWGKIFLTKPRSEGAGQLLRGHPTLDRHGEMFDWVAATFDTDDPSGDGIVGPAKTPAFFKDMDGVDQAVVHATNVTRGRETKAGNSLLIQNVRLEFTQRGHPALRIIRVNQIDHDIMAFENFVGPLPLPMNLSIECRVLFHGS
jgi:hypothetical protein